MNKELRILIYGDSRWRDSFGLSLLKHKLDQIYPESTVIVAGFDIAFPVTDLFRPHVAVFNHMLGKRNRTLSNFVKRQGGLSVVLANEGRPNNDGLMDWFVGQEDPDYLDLVLSWNDIATDRFTKVKAVTTGCPRFDIYRQPYSWLIQSKSEFCEFNRIDKEKPIIGITSSFPQAKFAYKNTLFHARDWKDLKMTTISGNEDPIAVAESELRSLEEYKFWIRVMVNKLKDKYNFMLKPHPLEDIHMWMRFCNEEGIYFIPGDYVFNFINACDLVVAKAGCVTHMDSWLSGVPTIHVSVGREFGKGGATDESLDYGFWYAEEYEELLYAISVFSEREKHSWECLPYLNKYGFTEKDAAGKCTEAIRFLIEERSPTVDDISLDSLVKINQMIYQHNAENQYPRIDDIGHFGKVITRDVVNNWISRINTVSI